ncbi:MAG: hypothetical protein IPK93_05025 [Solirubrobacterales bacterium]|nr:hypothetical protein [Solirubrobacterales bacterium]
MLALAWVLAPVPVASGSTGAGSAADEPTEGTAPQTRILDSPHGTTETMLKRARIRFRFGANAKRVKYKCRVDGRRWNRCKSPVRIATGPGNHRFAVRAEDRQGNVDRSPASRRWRIKRWEPHVKAARRYARSRGGPVSFAVDVGWRTFGYRVHLRAPVASTVKVMLMTAYLRRRRVRHRQLEAGEREMLGRMIRYSDNGAATSVRNIVGARGVTRLARQARLREFQYSPIWGICRTSARDQASLMRNLDRYIPRRHRGFAHRVLGHISRPQSWGIGTIGHRGWSLRFKGGWGISDHGHGGIVNHQIAMLQRGRRRVGIAILTQGNHSAGHGQTTLRKVSRLLLHGLPH